MSNTIDFGHLGQTISYEITQRDPNLLTPIPRSMARQSLPKALFSSLKGQDIWTLYEISWLDQQGKPNVGVIRLAIPCHSPNLVESKSLKLYCNSLNQTQFASRTLACQTIQNDLESVLEAPITLTYHPITPTTASIWPQDMRLLDDQAITCHQYNYDPTLLIQTTNTVHERVMTHLFRSNCPVTGQPDWATLCIDYHGQGFDHAALLRYLVSFRTHQDLHEHCVEQIYCDLMTHGDITALSVQAFFTRRGGIDIHPYRSNHNENPFDFSSNRL